MPTKFACVIASVSRLSPPLLVLLCASAHLQANGQIFSSKETAAGALVLSNFQTEATPELLVANPDRVVKPAASSVARLNGLKQLKGEKFRELVDSVASTVNLAPRLIHAVISAESNYNPDAVSSRGAIGLMQLLPATARRFGVSDPTVARDNIFAGASYLKWLMGYFGGDLELVLAAYNAGEQAVVRAGHKVPNYPETQAYVRRIMLDLNGDGGRPS